MIEKVVVLALAVVAVLADVSEKSILSEKLCNLY